MLYPNIDAERVRRQLSKDEFAKSLGVNMRTVSNWQAGITAIPVKKLVQISDMFDKSLDYLLGREP